MTRRANPVEAGAVRPGGSAPPGRSTRKLILRTAVELASIQGLQQLSLGKLATAVGMSKSGLFAHFDSKEALQLATIAEAWETFESEVLRNPDGHTDDALSELVERWLSFYERNRFPGGCLFLHQAVEFATRPGPVNDALASTVERPIKALEEHVLTLFNAQGRDAKEARQVASAIFSILVNADALFRVQHDPDAFHRAREAVRAVVGRPAGPSTRLQSCSPE